jgi:hypothetical protein
MKYLIYGAMALTVLFGVLIFMIAADCSIAAYLLGGFVGYLHVWSRKSG